MLNIAPWTTVSNWLRLPSSKLLGVHHIQRDAKIPMDESMRWRLDSFLEQAQFAPRLSTPSFLLRNPNIGVIITEVIIETALGEPQGTAETSWGILNTRVHYPEGDRGALAYANLCALFMAYWHDIVAYTAQFDVG